MQMEASVLRRKPQTSSPHAQGLDTREDLKLLLGRCPGRVGKLCPHLQTPSAWPGSAGWEDHFTRKTFISKRASYLKGVSRLITSSGIFFSVLLIRIFCAALIRF